MCPVAEMRIQMLSRMAPEGTLEKIGEAFGKPLDEQIHYGRTLAERIRREGNALRRQRKQNRRKLQKSFRAYDAL